MSPITTERGAGTHAFTPQPHDFLPTYEQHMNENLHRFSEPESQTVVKEFELEEQAPRKRYRLDLHKYWAWLLLVVVLVMAGSAFIASWLSGGFKKHGHQDQSSLSTRSEVTTTMSPFTATIIVTVTATPSPTDTATTTTLLYEPPSIPSVSSSAPSPLATVTSISTTQVTMTVDPTSTSSLAEEVSRTNSSLNAPPLAFPTQETTTFISVTAASPATVTITPPSTSAKPATTVHVTGGYLYWCGVWGNACG